MRARLLWTVSEAEGDRQTDFRIYNITTDPPWFRSGSNMYYSVMCIVAGPGLKAMAILNCLLARQLCFEDASCSAILEIIPRVCGSELGK